MARAVLSTRPIAALLLEQKRLESHALFSATLRSNAEAIRKMPHTQDSWTAFVMLAVHAGATTDSLSVLLKIPKRQVRRWRRGVRMPVATDAVRWKELILTTYAP